MTCDKCEHLLSCVKKEEDQVMVNGKSEIIVHCNLKENAELIAKILDADSDNEVYGKLVNGCQGRSCTRRKINMFKVLIDIDENVYTRLYDNELLVSDCLEVCKAVKNGEIVEQEDSVGGEYEWCRGECNT